MSNQQFEERLGHVETGLAGVKADVRVLGHDVAGVKADVGKIGDGVQQLLRRDAARPEPLTWKHIVGVCAGVVTVAIVVSWLIAQAPAVRDLEARVTDLDHPKRGRVPMLEDKVEVLQGWKATTRK